MVLAAPSWQRWRMIAPESSPLFREYLDWGLKARLGDLVDTSNCSIGPKDALIVVDMQCDLIPTDELNPRGGRFAVAEGGKIVPIVVMLMEHFASAGGVVVATRAYHPSDHGSFMSKGGPFPTHCVQGSEGSFFHVLVGQCLRKLQATGARAEVVFKGFREESLGEPDLSNTSRARTGSCSSPDWAEAQLLQCSMGKEDVNAPPDVLAYQSPKSLASYLKEQGVERVFVCGLALDFSVVDTAVSGTKAGFEKVRLLLDATRAAHIPRVGSLGSGFLSDPADLASSLKASGVRLTSSTALIPGLTASRTDSEPDWAHASLHFPDTFGPFALVEVKLSLTVELHKNRYEADESSSVAAALKKYAYNLTGTVSPATKLSLDAATRRQLGIPAQATQFAFAYPLNGAGTDASKKVSAWARGYLSSTSPEASFFTHGGFIYMDQAGKVLSVFAKTVGEGLSFEPPQRWRGQFSADLTGRWRPVDLPFLAAKGAKLFAWINPGEVLSSPDAPKWEVAQQGAVVFLFHDDIAVQDSKDVYFAVRSLS